MANVTEINRYLQEELRKRKLVEVEVIRAASWLDEAGLLNDDKQRPGRNLRQLCRENKIDGAIQREARYWFVQIKGN
jgi:hypothetical protein